MFRACDATSTRLRSGSFDAVVCVFGVFFAADMPAFVAEMWRLVRPGGTLAITTWGPEWCEPASSVFWDSVRELEPTLFRAFNPWDEITTAPKLADLFARGGVSGATVEATEGESHELDRPEAFWDIAPGSGYRATVDAFSDRERERLRARVVDELRARHITRLRNDVVFGTAVRGKPGEHFWHPRSPFNTTRRQSVARRERRQRGAARYMTAVARLFGRWAEPADDPLGIPLRPGQRWHRLRVLLVEHDQQPHQLAANGC